MIQQSLRDELRRRGDESPVAALLTETVVDRDDGAFGSPTKPIGPFYSEEQAAKLRKEKGWTIIDDSGRGFRRVVPSPRPTSIVEGPVIKMLFEEGVVVIAAGGGGVPVIVRADGLTTGVEAVIDKDLSASVLASTVGAEMLLILTDVENIFLDYGKPSMRPISRMTRAECRTFLDEGQFPAGSMRPKVEAALSFLDSGGKTAVITSLEGAREAVRLERGTVVVP